MIHSIRTVKQEIRVLGLDTCGKKEVFGAVVRGGSFLDGVVRFALARNGERQLSSEVLATKYYPELRVLMLHDPGKRLVSDRLEKVVGLYVIRISERASNGYSVFRSEHSRVFQKSHLTCSTVDRILSVTWTYGTLPEPVRIAHLLASRRPPISRA